MYLCILLLFAVKLSFYLAKTIKLLSRTLLLEMKGSVIYTVNEF